MNFEKIAALFDGWEETMIWSALQGVMGEITADGPENPKSARILLGDFGFFAGEPNERLVSSMLENRSFLLAVPQNEEWAACMEKIFPNSRRIPRYAMAALTGKGCKNLPGTSRRNMRWFLSTKNCSTECRRKNGAGISARTSKAGSSTPGTAAGLRPFIRGKSQQGRPPIPPIGRAWKSRWTPKKPTAGRAWPSAAAQTSSCPAWKRGNTPAGTRRTYT